MEKVIVIFENNHGYLGLATNALSAARWLVGSGWISPSDDIYIYQERTCKDISEIMEEHGYIQLEDFVADFIDGKYDTDYSLPFRFSTETIH